MLCYYRSEGSAHSVSVAFESATGNLSTAPVHLQLDASPGIRHTAPKGGERTTQL